MLNMHNACSSFVGTGVGEFGIVYRAKLNSVHGIHSREVAVKTLKGAYALQMMYSMHTVISTIILQVSLISWMLTCLLRRV